MEPFRARRLCEVALQVARAWGRVSTIPGLGFPFASVAEPRMRGTPARMGAKGVDSPVTPGVGGTPQAKVGSEAAEL